MTAQASLPGIQPTEWGGELDFYETPSFALDALLPFIPARFRQPMAFDLIEPCAGRGAIVRWAVETLRPALVNAVEIHHGRFDELFALRGSCPNGSGFLHADFLKLPTNSFRVWRPLLVVTNSPYSEPRETIAREICEHALEVVGPSGCVAMLLPLGFAEGVDRAERIHDHYPSSVYVFRRRPRFGGDQGGQRPFAWFCWDRLEPKNEWRSI